MKTLIARHSVAPAITATVLAVNLFTFSLLLSACKDSTAGVSVISNPGSSSPPTPNPDANSGISSSVPPSLSPSPGQNQPSWRLTAWTRNGKPVPLLPGVEVSLGIATQEGQINGFGGCNQYGAAYHLVGDRVVVDPLRATRRACDGPIMAQEETFLAALQQVNQINLKAGERLTLTYGEKNAAGSLVFAPQ